MVSAILFIAHGLFLIYIFIIKRKRESLSAAFQNTLLIVVLFTVAWALLTMIVNMIIEPKGFGKEFDRDGISLFLVTAVEILFYRIYYRSEFTIEGGKEKQ